MLPNSNLQTKDKIILFFLTCRLASEENQQEVRNQKNSFVLGFIKEEVSSINIA